MVSAKAPPRPQSASARSASRVAWRGRCRPRPQDDQFGDVEDIQSDIPLINILIISFFIIYLEFFTNDADIKTDDDIPLIISLKIFKVTNDDSKWLIMI